VSSTFTCAVTRLGRLCGRASGEIALVLIADDPAAM
jgi:hypothetical protein